jgi:hypothetical protein
MKGERSGFLKSVIEAAGTLRKTNQHVPVTHETTGARKQQVPGTGRVDGIC